MPHVFTDTTARSTVLPQNSCLINYSVLTEFYSPNPFRSFSIKYVAEGSELYSVNGKKYLIKDRQYLLANRFAEGCVEVDSKKPVKGICIDLAPCILSEVVGSCLRPDTAMCDPGLDTFFNTCAFMENRYSATGTQVGYILRKLESHLAANPSAESDFSEEFYFRISEALIADHIPVLKQLRSIKALKQETKKDLLRKLYIAREFMDTSFLANLSIETIAREAGISEFHFYRLFRHAFGTTPHQYLIQRRLEHSLHMLKQGETSISTVAIASGFSDIFGFSRSFKKQFGFPPSQSALHFSRI